MQIGILNAFPPDYVLSGCDTPVDAYIRFLELAQPPFEYTGFDVAEGRFPDAPEVCDAYLITGSPMGVYDPDPWIAELGDFIRAAYAAGKKLVGICFGHQMLAHALGGHSAKSEKGWGLGLKQFDVGVRKPWMTAALGQFSLHFVHQDQVIQLPPGAELLGGNEFCPNLFFTIENRVLGIQGHPEFNAEVMGEIISSRIGIFGEHLASAAVRAIESGSPDNQTIAEWIANFLLTK